MKRKWSLIAAILIIGTILITQIPREADAKGTSASAFHVQGNVLVEYTGTDTEVMIPKNVEVIGKSAFENNHYIEKVIIPSNVKEVEPYAFWGCDYLTTVIGCEGLSEYGDYSFANCASLTTFPIPENIERIGLMAFADDHSLNSINIPYTVWQIHDTAFDGCSKLNLIVIKGTEGERFASVFEEKKKEMPEYDSVIPKETKAPESTIVETTNEKEEQVVVEPVTTPAPQGTTAPEKQDPDAKVYGSSVSVSNMVVIFWENKPEVKPEEEEEENR